MEDGASNVVILSRFLVVAGVAFPLICLFVMGTIFDGDSESDVAKRGIAKRLLRLALPLGILSPFIAPWLALGLYSAWRVNWNGVQGIQRPPVVEPVPQEHIKAQDVKPEKPQ